MYFYVSPVGNLGKIRRALVEDVFKGREDVVLNHNPHTSVKADIGTIICPKGNVERLVAELKKRKIRRLMSNYKPLHLSPISRHFGGRKVRETRAHELEVLRNLQRRANGPSDEEVTQKFNQVLSNTKLKLAEDENKEEEEDKMDLSDDEKEDTTGGSEDQNAAAQPSTEDGAMREKEKVNPNTGQKGNTTTNSQQKLLVWPRQPSDRPLRHTMQKKDGAKHTGCKQKGCISDTGQQVVPETLTEEQKKEKEAEIIAAMVRLARKDTAADCNDMRKQD